MRKRGSGTGNGLRKEKPATGGMRDHMREMRSTTRDHMRCGYTPQAKQGMSRGKTECAFAFSRMVGKG